MSNSHDEIKNLLRASRNLLSNGVSLQENIEIKKQYGIILEQGSTGDITKKIDIGASIEDSINKDEKEYETADDTVGEDFDDEDFDGEEKKEDKKQAYRISGGILVLHGKDKTELDLTTDEKMAFQETMDEFVTEVSDLVDFNKLNVYPNNVEWSGKIIDYDIEFMYNIGEESGIYINGDMIKTDEDFIEMITKLQKYYEKFKSKWAKILASRKKTKQ
jgi:hypothetical protein